MPIDAVLNKRLTEVGPATPAGKLHRYYWHPIAGIGDVNFGSCRQIRILGERLILFRDTSGRLGLIGEKCSHRGASLAYGIVEQRGIRCAYHGWLYDTQGNCLERPTEFDCEAATNVSHPSYAVAELGGLVFAYIGPQPIPAMPRFDIFDDLTFVRSLRVAIIPCNWLQIMENSLDPLHLEWLHGHFSNYRSQSRGLSPSVKVDKHVELAFEQTSRGIVKRRRAAGQSKESEDWTVGQEVIFPNIFCIASPGKIELQIRVPMDDQNTFHIWYQCVSGPPEPVTPLCAEQVELLTPSGSFNLDTIDGQDAMAWVTQGRIADRSRETLSRSDDGIVMYRELLAQQIDTVENGNSPIRVSFSDRYDPIDIVRRRETQRILSPL